MFSLLLTWKSFGQVHYDRACTSYSTSPWHSWCLWVDTSLFWNFELMDPEWGPQWAPAWAHQPLPSWRLPSPHHPPTVSLPEVTPALSLHMYSLLHLGGSTGNETCQGRDTPANRLFVFCSWSIEYCFPLNKDWSWNPCKEDIFLDQLSTTQACVAQGASCKWTLCWIRCSLQTSYDWSEALILLWLHNTDVIVIVLLVLCWLTEI